MQLRISHKQAEAQLFPTTDLTPWGHWSFHNHFLRQGEHEYCPQRLPWLYDIFSKSKARKLADHRPTISKSLWMKALPCLWSDILLSQRTAAHKLLTKPCYRVNLSILLSHGAPSSLSEERCSLRLCVDFQGLNWIPKKDQYPLLLISNLLDAPQSMIYTRSSPACVPPCMDSPGDEWKTEFQTLCSFECW